VLESLGAMLARQFGYVADAHFMCLKGNVGTRRRQQMITSFNTSPDCKVCLLPSVSNTLCGIKGKACALCAVLYNMYWCGCTYTCCCQTVNCAAAIMMAHYVSVFWQDHTIGKPGRFPRTYVSAGRPMPFTVWHKQRPCSTFLRFCGSAF
jgi:hypothetical protein